MYTYYNSCKFGSDVLPRTRSFTRINYCYYVTPRKGSHEARENQLQWSIWGGGCWVRTHPLKFTSCCCNKNEPSKESRKAQKYKLAGRNNLTSMNLTKEPYNCHQDNHEAPLCCMEEMIPFSSLNKCSISVKQGYLLKAIQCELSQMCSNKR